VNVHVVAAPQDIIGKRVVEVGDREYGERTMQHALRAMDSGEVVTWEFGIPTRQEITYEARFARSGPDECLVLVRDISDMVANRESLERAVNARTEQLQLSNDELRQFAYAASHDLREPLLKVKAFGQRIQEKYSDNLPEKGTQYLEVMLEATKRMQALMDDLLQYSRIGRLEDPFKPVDLDQVIETVLGDLSVAFADSNAQVEITDLPEVCGDRIQLGILFQNLISNSLKFRHPDRRPLVTLTAQVVDNHWVISVADNGIGFDMKFREKVFQLFERLHTRFEYPGTGIGLALCKKIVDRHDGWIDCESIPGKGTTFHVGIPRKAE
jgi:light-regulated signal transduction histidine kinase (bacteriophytochrome)